MKKFISLKVSHLRLDDLAGLVSESIVIADQQKDALGSVITAKLGELGTANYNFRQWLNVRRSSALTLQIANLDKERGGAFREIKSTAKAAEQSVVPAMSTSGAKLMEILRPIWDINAEPLMSQTVQLTIFIDRINSETIALTALKILGLMPVFTALTEANTKLKDLYNQRLNEMSPLEGNSATNNSKELIAIYDDFCTAVEITLSAQPSDALQTVFNEMNELRRKYIYKVPTPLSEARTSVAPIPEQIYTGRHLTPLPRVFYKTNDAKLYELVFAQDFTVTYQNNMEVGEAKLSVHGKGNYTGRYDTTFHIVRP
jgi:hypothetical protein